MKQNQFGPKVSAVRKGAHPGFTLHTLFFGKKRLVEEAAVQNGHFHGEYLRYHKNGHVAMRSFYKEGMLHGPSTCYYLRDQIASECFFEEGLPQNKARFYYQSGALHHALAFTSGKLHGVQEFFYESGALKCELVFDQGLLSDKAKLYFPDQTLRREVELKQGKRDGLDLCYDTGGMILFALEYKNGIFCKCQIEDSIATTYQLG